MSANRHLDHVIVLPEDAANHNIATGFKQEIPADRQTMLQILPAAGGWIPAFDALRNNHATSMRKFAKRRLVLLIDFDGHVGATPKSLAAECREGISDLWLPYPCSQSNLHQKGRPGGPASPWMPQLQVHSR